MGKMEVNTGELLYTTSERVSEIGILLKGAVTVSSSTCSIRLGYGSIIGLFEVPGEFYRFDYEVEENAVIYSYPYRTVEDLCSIIRANQKICPILTETAVTNVRQVHTQVSKIYEVSRQFYDSLVAENAEMEELCTAAGEVYIPDPFFENLPEPTKPDLREFENRFFESIPKEQYALGPEFCTGIILYAGQYINYLVERIESLVEDRMKLHEDASGFLLRMSELRRWASEADGQKTSAKERYLEGDNVIEIKGALDSILAYAGMSSDQSKDFRKALSDFGRLSDKTDQSDNARRIRKSLAEKFYGLYEQAFLKSVYGTVPLEVRMFLMFGFVDETLAGKENTAALAYLADTYKPDPEGRVLTIWEWLKLIYEKKIDPSKNEFDMEYPAYLKDQYNNGEIRQSEINTLLNSGKERALFEIRNFFNLANRMTYGRISSFVPVFFAEDHIKTPDQSILTAKAVKDCLDEIRAVDYSCFCREILYTNPKIGINREYIDTEILPYVVLRPNAGGRGALWQEISGSKRDTPARMMVPLFPSSSPKQFFTTLAGEFRWEMCRREQGVHWNDVTVPSLTSEYSDYLQFYRKNHDLSPEIREKIKSQLQSARNSAKGVFVSDYINYMEYEKNGSLRLNKTARSIVFRYCPFPKETREKLALSTPAYSDLVDKFNVKREQRKHLLDIVVQKVGKAGVAVPKEIQYELEYLQR